MAELLGKILHIEIVDKGKEAVNLAIPLGILHLVTKTLPAEELEKYGINIMEILKLIEESATKGQIIDIKDPKKNSRVKIYLE